MQSRKIKPKPKLTMPLNTCQIVLDSEIGLKRKCGFNDALAKKIYATMAVYNHDQLDFQCHGNGGIFNLEFNLDGRTLAAACEHKSVVLFDAGNQKAYKTMQNAHDGCVNCIRFLDSNLFATCSDDNTIKLWDMRKLENCVQTLNGHTNWVKNIEYVEKDKILVTSGFDGAILAWDLNNLSENNLVYDSLYVMRDLMRTKITNDGSKMVLSSTNGYLMIVHDLHLPTLNRDIGFFKPNLYRYLQEDEICYPSSAVFSFLFSQERRRNRIELIDDFPNQPKMISSLKLHPMGWCALTRNANGQETEEWTAVHDIQTRPFSEYDKAFKIAEEIAEEAHIEESTLRNGRWLTLLSRINQRLLRAQASASSSHLFEDFAVDTDETLTSMVRSEDEEEYLKYKKHIFLNINRLTNFIEEKNAGKGYIKEQCFSRDGRIICSPFGRGVRLLAFNDKVQELNYCIPKHPESLYTVKELRNHHPKCVVSCKFSPIHNQLVTGCLKGEIIWYKPLF